MSSKKATFSSSMKKAVDPVLSLTKKAGEVIGPIVKELAIIGASAAATAVSTAVLSKYTKNINNDE